MKIIAHIHTSFPTKFGIPRQSGLAPTLRGEIVFVPEYRNPDALRGLEGYSHLWLIWEFSERRGGDTWSPTVRPPRLGGNKRMGVFATRSPNRPNPIGLSSVVLERIDYTENRGPVLYVRGADLLDGTPIYDIKPYLPFTDSHPDARGGFADEKKDYMLRVECDDTLLAPFSDDDRQALLELLSEDPRPSYQEDPSRIYGMEYAGFEVRFQVSDRTLYVRQILKITEKI